MTHKHTPGPWLFRLEAVRTVIFHKAEFGEKAIAVGAGHYPDHIANARLIAAAPEMLEALIELDASIEKRWAGETYKKRANAVSPRTEEALEAARAVIAKATGDAS